MRLINADELRIKLADELSDALGETDFTDGLQYGLKLAISLAEETPIVDAKPIRHGHWLPVEGRIICLKCSVCGDWFDLDYSEQEEEFKYCPLCGAKMDEPSETSDAIERRNYDFKEHAPIKHGDDEFGTDK